MVSLLQRFGFSLLFACLAVGCNQPGGEPAARQDASSSAPAKQSAPRVTPMARDQWTAGLAALYVESGGKPDANGVTRFSACFEPGCIKPLIGTRDPFDGALALNGPRSAFDPNRDLNLGLLLIAPYCSDPTLVLRPTYSGESWIFMDSVGVMADGEIALRLHLEKPSTDVIEGGVLEQGSYILSAEELSKLRALPAAKVAMARFSGSKGVRTLPDRTVRQFIDDIGPMLAAYDKLRDYHLSNMERCKAS